MLAQRLENLKVENDQLKSENRRLRQEKESSRQSLESLSTRLQVEKKHWEKSGSVPFESSDVMRQQIDHYIQEIDACIEWLTKNEIN